MLQGARATRAPVPPPSPVIYDQRNFCIGAKTARRKLAGDMSAVGADGFGLNSVGSAKRQVLRGGCGFEACCESAYQHASIPWGRWLFRIGRIMG